MSAVSAPRDNSQGGWDKFKDVLRDLYITQGLPLQAVMDIMESRHAFKRSKCRYTSQFRKWGFEKYSKSTDSKWKAASLKVHKGRQRGKEVQLYHMGKKVTAKMLRTRGFLQASDSQNFEDAMSPKTPPEFKIEIQSPFISSELEFPSNNLWNTLKTCTALSPTLCRDDFKTTLISLQSSTPFQNMGTSTMPPYLPLGSSCLVPSISENGLQQVDMEHWLRFITYVLANNHLQDLDDEDKNVLIQIFQNMGALPLLGSYPFSNEPCAQAILESIFRLAIEAEDLKTVEQLLRNGMDPVGCICHFDYYSHIRPQAVNAFQFSLLAGNLPLAKLLLLHGAKMDEPGSGWKSSAIVLAIIGWSRVQSLVDDEDNDIWSQREEEIDEITAFVKFLIAKGAVVDMDQSSIDLTDFYDPALFIDEHYLSVYLDSRISAIWERHSPLTIASRNHIPVLFDIFLSANVIMNTSFTGELDRALHAVVLGYIGLIPLYQRACGYTFTQPECGRYHDPQHAFFEMMSRLVHAGADINSRFSHVGVRGNLWKDFTVLELVSVHLDYSSDWNNLVIAALLDLGANPTAFAFRKALTHSNYSVCSQLFSADPSVLLLDGDVYDISQLVEPGQESWLIRCVDKLDDEDVRVKVVREILEFCNIEVSKNLFRSCQCLPILLARHTKEFLDIESFLPALIAMAPERLEHLCGKRAQDFIDALPEIPKGLIHMSIIHGNLSLAKYFIDAGLDVNHVADYDHVPETALCAAIRQRDTELVEMLVKRGSKFDVEAGWCQCGLVRRINPLVAAIEVEDIDLVLYLITKGANLNACGLSHNLNDHDIIHFADSPRISCTSSVMGKECECACISPLAAYLLRGNDPRFVQILLDLGAQPNSLVVDGHTNHLSPLGALFAPCREHYNQNCQFLARAAQMLLNAGANPLDTVALTLACRTSESDLNLLEELLQRTLRPPAASGPSLARNAALLQAIRLMQPKLVEALLNSGVARVPVEGTGLESGDSGINRRIFGEYKRNRCSFIPPQDSPFYVALMEQNEMILPETRYQIIQSLLLAGFSPNSHGCMSWGDDRPQSIVLQALQLRDDDDGVILKLLLDGGARISPAECRTGDPFQMVKFPLGSAVKMKMLFKCGIKPANNPKSLGAWHGRRETASALQHAAFFGFRDVVQFLISEGEDVDATGSQSRGATALQFALIEKHFDVAELLIEKGADLNAPPCLYDGTTCLQIAASAGNLELVKDMVRKGANVNALPDRRIEGTATALQCAARKGSLEVMRYLVEHGADVNAPASPNCGATALQFAAIYGFIPIAEYLIRHEADLNAPPAEKDGRMALEGAAENGRLDMVQLLLYHGAGRGEDNRENVERACQRAKENGYMAIRNLVRGAFDY